MMQEYGFDFEDIDKTQQMQQSQLPNSSEAAASQTKFASGGVVSPVKELQKIKVLHKDRIFGKNKIQRQFTNPKTK